MTDYVLVGGGAFGRELHDWFAPGLAEHGHHFVGYLDDGDAPMQAFGRALPQLGKITGARIDPAMRLVMAIGDPAGKASIAQALGAAAFDTLVHPRAWVSASAKLGRGCVIGPFADVSADAVAGAFVGLNAYASIGHDAEVGDYSTLSGYVDLTGGVKVGSGAFLGSGCRVLPGLKVGDGCVIGAGAVMLRNAPAGTTYYAAPARRL
jgi:sugar O-acyltransferase (sialic acid O-acetyltransferase NeuD family)